MKKPIQIAILLLISLIPFILNGCGKETIQEVIKQEEIKQDSGNIYKDDLVELNAILETSCYESKVEIDNKGNVFRTDNNGNTTKYNLNDIKEVKTDYDGFYNLLIFFKEEKFALTTIDGVESKQTLNVFSFANSDDCEKAKEILFEIISK